MPETTATAPPVSGQPQAGPSGQKVKLKVNGREVEVPAGTSILNAAKALGVHVPVFCYHPGLSVAGNCRMCMVEASNSKKPVASCCTPVAEGIDVLTESDMAKKSRAGVLEMMLLNHPLDCPICDKSGECMLQDNSYGHGKSDSRMVEDKVLRHTKDLGSTIHIWGNRCIVCTRCVRFCDEVSGTGELCVVERGDRSVVDVFEGYPLANPLAGNTVDLCPVGALISKDFLYQARVWNTTRTDTLCAGCSRGCNIEAQTLDNKIVRLVPRENRSVNDWWMCDYGRYDYRFVLSPTRVLAARPPLAPGETAGQKLARELRAVAKKHGPKSVAGIASAFMTCEELLLFKKLFGALGSDRLGAIARPNGVEEKLKSFTIAADKNPNRAGARRILGRDTFEKGYDSVLDGVARGEVKALVVVADQPHAPLPARVVELLTQVELGVVVLLEKDKRLPEKVWILPATTFIEKDGTIVNDRDRAQRLRPALALPRLVRPEMELLQQALIEIGERRAVLSSASVFRELGKEAIPALSGKSQRDLGKLGLDVTEGAKA